MDTDRINQPLLGSRIAYIDRRSLSQAWYSALHTTAAASAAAKPPAKPAALPKEPALRAHAAAAPLRAGERSPAFARGVREQSAPAHEPPSKARPARESRRMPAPQARIARREFAAGSVLTLTFKDARIHVHVRRAQAGLNVVAVCSHKHIEAVSRALAGVERSLRSEGETVRASVVPLGCGR